MVPAPKRCKFKYRKRNNGQIKFLLNYGGMMMTLLQQQPNMVKLLLQAFMFCVEKEILLKAGLNAQV